MEWWHVYLFTRLDGIHNVCIVLFVIGLICTIVGIPGLLMSLNWAATFGIDSSKNYVTFFLRLCKITPIFMIVGGLLSVIVPTQKEAAVIYLLPKLAHSDFAKEAQQIPTDAAKLMRIKLESWISDLEHKK